MQLDRTRIAIRERTFPDILDLSLRVCMAYFWPLVKMVAIVGLPMAILNWFLIGWMPGLLDEQEQIYRYYCMMVLLVFFEAPILSLAITLYMGSAMFLEEPQPKEIFKSILKRSVAIFWTQFCLRGILPAWLLLWSVQHSYEFSAAEVWTVFLAIYVAIVRAIRPFIVEILLLERNPLRAKGDYQMTAGRRSSALHNPNAGDLLVRWLMSAVVATFGGMAIFFTVWCGIGIVTFMWRMNWSIVHIVLPSVMWIVAGYFCVVRFLCYLDLRIRREGWEVELIMRAASTELAGQPV